MIRRPPRSTLFPSTTLFRSLLPVVAAARVQVTPTTVYLPFNRDCLRGEFEPAKHGGPPPAPRGHWLLGQEQKLVVVPEGGGVCLPTGGVPTGLDGGGKQPLWLGADGGPPGWGGGAPRGPAPPQGVHRGKVAAMQ